MKEFLNCFTKERLLAIADYFLVPVRKNMKKMELADAVESHLSRFTFDSLSLLPERDLKLLDKLCDLGADYPLKVEYPDSISFVEVLGFVNTSDDHPEKLTLSVPKAVAELFGPVVKNVIRHKERSGDFDEERIILGVLNTYGVLTLKEFVDVVFDFISTDTDPEQIGKKTAVNPFVRMGQFFSEGQLYVACPSLTDVQYLLDQRKKFVRKNSKLARYSREQMIAAGSGSPFCFWDPDSQEVSDLRSMFDKLGYEESEVESLIHGIWLASQTSDSEESEEEMFSCVTDLMDEIPTFDLYKDYIETIVTYVNTVPKWLLRGRCANEAGVLKVNVKVSRDDDMSMPESVADYFKYSLAVERALPNDPCPCGSGHLYRLCHGRYLN